MHSRRAPAHGSAVPASHSPQGTARASLGCRHVADAVSGLLKEWLPAFLEGPICCVSPPSMESSEGPPPEARSPVCPGAGCRGWGLGEGGSGEGEGEGWPGESTAFAFVARAPETPKSSPGGVSLDLKCIM